MALTYSGRSTPILTGINYQATGSNGEQVVVEVSNEVISDLSEWDARAKGEEKYDAGEFTVNSANTVTVITVRKEDFK
jgi:hypothetical protein